MGQIDDDILDPLIRNNAFKAIEKLMEPDTKLACLALLAVYTDILGTLYSITITKEGNRIIYERPDGNATTFKKCLEYMGDDYVKVNNVMRPHGHSIKKIVRNGVVHEFEPKISYQININKSITKSIGFEYLPPITITINLKEYFRDLKKGFNKWTKELEDDPHHEKMMAVVNTSGYMFPPQGGISKIESPDGEFIYKTK